MILRRSMCLSITITMTLSLVACAEDEPANPSVYGNWAIISESGETGLGLTLREDKTYTTIALVLTSEKSANAEITTGTFTDNGTTFALTPQQSSCRGPQEVEVINHTFNPAGALVLSLPSGVLALKKNNAQSPDSFVLVFGCYDKDRNFLRSELAPVDK